MSRSASSTLIYSVDIYSLLTKVYISKDFTVEREFISMDKLVSHFYRTKRSIYKGTVDLLYYGYKYINNEDLEIIIENALQEDFTEDSGTFDSYISVMLLRFSHAVMIEISKHLLDKTDISDFLNYNPRIVNIERGHIAIKVD